MIRTAGERARQGALEFRAEPRAGDPERIRALVTSTGSFRDAEVAIAVELVEEALAKGCTASGYHFLFAEERGEMTGYACYGPIACTLASFDLYWIAVHPRHQRAGIGRRLMTEVEARVRASGGERIYIDTSHRSDYASTRAFYETCGYAAKALLADFYAPGDDKAIYCKSLRDPDQP